jgi:stress response protein YsnF
MSEDRDKTRTEEVIPLPEETLRIERRERVNEIVRITSVVHEQQQIVDEPVTSTEVEVRRVPIERWVDAPVADRMEGETLIISLHREIPVVQRRLQVFEEIHITPHRHEERHTQPVTLRREDAIIERATPSPDE